MKENNFYQIKINKVLGYINNNLENEISIKKLAKVANFSLFHFQRIYKALQNETPYETLLRLRLEKAIFLLIHRDNLKILDIAIICGFSSHENFSRQFKIRYKLSPKQYKLDYSNGNSTIHQETRAKKQHTECNYSKSDFNVTVEHLNAIPIVYIRGIFGTDGSELIEKYLYLIKWADENNINYQNKLSRFGMSIDNPDVTPEDKYRYDFAIAEKNKCKVDGLIEKSEIPAGLFATLHCQGDLNHMTNAWNYLYKKWLPQSKYMPLHFPAIEEFIQGPEQIGWNNFNIKCRIAITKRNTYD